MRKRETTRQRKRSSAAVAARLSYANVMSTIAVFGVLAGGGAWAASKIGPHDIAKKAVRAKHIKNNQIRARHIKRNQVRTKHIADGAVSEAKLADGLEGLRGPAGPKGDQGATGDPGPKGDQGDPGAPSWSADCNEGLPADDVMVRVGPVCLDRYEASAWSARTGGTQLVSEAQIDAACPDDGQDCKGKIFARSQPGVEPARDITWFQAQQALVNSGKRLPSNAEWQMAVSGTPDGAPCNVNSTGPVNTGSAAACISDHGVNDMVGNVMEWVADWDEEGASCGSWSFGADLTCVGRGSGEASTRFPGALVRGGGWANNTAAGAFAVSAVDRPSESTQFIGFRGAR